MMALFPRAQAVLLLLALGFLSLIIHAKNEVSVMIYSYSFGGYRGEKYSTTSPVLNNTREYPRFFFHDDIKSCAVCVARDKALLADGWILHNVSNPIKSIVAQIAGKNSSMIITEHSRLLTSNHNRMKVKIMKFKYGFIQHVFKDFDYVMHVDFSTFGLNRNLYFVPKYADLSALLRKQPNVGLFLLKHNNRDYVTQEWIHTTRNGMEKNTSMSLIKRDILTEFGQTCVRSTLLYALGHFVRKNKGAEKTLSFINKVMENTLSQMVQYGVVRDQNVFPFSLMRELRRQANSNSSLVYMSLFFEKYGQISQPQGHLDTSRSFMLPFAKSKDIVGREVSLNKKCLLPTPQKQKKKGNEKAEAT